MQCAVHHVKRGNENVSSYTVVEDVLSICGRAYSRAVEQLMNIICHNCLSQSLEMFHIPIHTQTKRISYSVDKQ